MIEDKELADFIRHTKDSLDEEGKRQLEAAIRYLAGREEPAKLDVNGIKRRTRIHATGVRLDSAGQASSN